MATSLKTMFILVTEDKHDSFIETYLNPSDGVTRDTTYDDKIVFLEKTQEIFTKGRIYGINNNSDVEALTLLIGTLPKKEDNSEYANIIEYIQEMCTGGAEVATTIKNDITVAGGPLADDLDHWPEDWTKDGNRIIPAGLSFEQILTTLFCKVVNGTLSTVTYVWNPVLVVPTIDVKVNGVSAKGKSYEVGTEAVVSFSTKNTVTGNTSSASITASQGYFIDNSYTAGNYRQAVNGNVKGTLEISQAIWNGDDVEDGNTVTIGESDKNILTVEQSGLTAYVNDLTETTVYAANNVKGKVETVSKTVEAKSYDEKPLSSITSLTCKGVRYMFYGSFDYQAETIDSALIRTCDSQAAAVCSMKTDGTSDCVVSISEGSKQVIIAVPSAYKISEVHDKGAFGTDIFSEFVKQNVDVEGANAYAASEYNVYVYSPKAQLGENTYYVKVETA